MDKRAIKVNYLYFGVFLILLLFTSGGGIFTKPPLSGSRFFFFLYALGQALFEVAAFMFIQWLCQRFLGKIASMLFIGITFTLLFFHLLDFVMDRILNLSAWETICFVFDETWDNFLYLLDASGVSFWIWMLCFSATALIPVLGALLYWWTEKFFPTKPLYIRYEHFLQTFICIPAALIFWEFSASSLLHPDAYTSFIKSIPWKLTFLSPKSVQYPLPAALQQPHDEIAVQKAILQDKTWLGVKPNIYLFIAESLREDFLTEDVAPHLYAFKQSAAPFSLTLSNANGSHLSWFSLFHSQFSYAWRIRQQMDWKMGSPPLALLKKWGYKIRVYSSAELNYYGMEEFLFGSKNHLVDSYQTFHHRSPVSAADSDEKTVAKWKEDLLNHPEWDQGQVFIFFWDSTHFNYSWPSDWKIKFTPIAKEIDYLKIFQSEEDIAKIKNRYRNAISYIDSLFGDFLHKVSLQKNAVIAFLGDHGEEFFEHGHLFHGSHLSQEQTHVPIYIKFGQRKVDFTSKLVSQMDVFPSILHHLKGEKIPFLEGQSIFERNRWPYVVACRFNGGKTPYEFLIHNGAYKMIVQFPNRKNIFAQESLRVCSVSDLHDESGHCESHSFPWIASQFDPAVARLFRGSCSKK